MQCHAKSKRSGAQCKSWAVKGKKVCRMHGAFAGIKTLRGRERQIEAVTKHGAYSKESKEERRQIAKMVKDAKDVIASLP